MSVRVARRARALAIRRNVRERTTADPPEIAARDERETHDLRAAIDEELRRLPGPLPGRPWSCSTSKV